MVCSKILFHTIIRKIYILVLVKKDKELTELKAKSNTELAQKLAQKESEIAQINAKIDKDRQRLLGNVLIKHKDVTMSCDSAYYYKNKNRVRAFSKVHIEQGDTLDLYGDYLHYDGITEI
jgi:lipopolysaccharide assembly outer membrane protein LptD (OstA)